MLELVSENQSPHPSQLGLAAFAPCKTLSPDSALPYPHPRGPGGQGLHLGLLRSKAPIQPRLYLWPFPTLSPAFKSFQIRSRRGGEGAGHCLEEEKVA